MKINSDLGYEPVTYSELTDDEEFWAGCKSCVNYEILQSKERKNCMCTAMLYDPADHYTTQETSAEFKVNSKLYERFMKFKQNNLLKWFRKKKSIQVKKIQSKKNNKMASELHQVKAGDKVVLGFSGGLDTSYCVKYLTDEKGYEVHSVIVNTGGFSEEELKNIEAHAYNLGVKTHTTIDAVTSYYDSIIKYLIYGNVLKNNTYPLSVSAERLSQALHIAEHAKKIFIS
jgi:hypothetical protein